MRSSDALASRLAAYPDEVVELLHRIDAAIASLRDGRGPGPYGAIEAIESAVNDFLDASECDD